MVDSSVTTTIDLDIPLVDIHFAPVSSCNCYKLFSSMTLTFTEEHFYHY